MLICKQCFEKQNKDVRDEEPLTWELAPKVYDQCELCLRQILCAEL